MDEFEKRGQAIEAKFAQDAELRFKAKARRNRLLGLWAAEHLGLSGPDAENYAKEVIKSDLQEPGDEDVFRKIRGDFDAQKIDLSDHRIRRTMNELLVRAFDEIGNGTENA